MKLRDLFVKPPAAEWQIKKPYIIAEAGVNHGQSMSLAKRLVAEAKEAGASAIKFQTYKAETLASRHSPCYWDITKETTRSQFDLFKKYDKFWKKEFELLKKYCDQCDIEFLSTPFDLESAAFLNDLMDVYKISSSDITNKPFIEYICRFGKPVILSTGASDVGEIKSAVKWIRHNHNPLALLHCVLNYPTKDMNANLGMILHLKSLFPENFIGYSDHTLPKDMKTLELAWLLGATILEKHFTYDKKLSGNDHYHAMDKKDLKLFIRRVDRAMLLLGGFEKQALPSEDPARLNARRSLVAKQDILSGKKICFEDLTWKRPAHGISPKDIDGVVGRVVARDIKKDDLITESCLGKL